ncbi:beta-lactamase family protein [Lactiplantibacillus plantarum]|uniref:beta-lactamase family protein n=1 Tax=Lactiplantibacillus plantarum TaxID=1590 RepID=UPI001D070A64|nr:beta-lactamase family protein [Lactiplantibacillus plantarum]MCB7178152.1 beta-lactamase family protein [Lactiplantibacillus plantarum]
MKKKVALSVLLVLLLLGGIFIYKKVYFEYFSKNMSKVKQVTAITSKVVPVSTNLGKNNKLHGKRIETLNTSLTQQHFMGAYIKTSGSKIINSDGFGQSNILSQIEFSYNTTVRIGNLESLINTAILLKQVQEKKIDLTTNLKKYVPELSNVKSFNVKDLMRGSVNIWINKDKLANMNESQATRKFFNSVVTENQRKTGKRVANNILLAIVISRIDQKKYSELINDFENDLDLSGTTLLNGNNGGAKNDRNAAISYYYKADSDGNPNPGKAYLNVDNHYTFGVDQLRMSMTDILNVIYALNTNEILSKPLESELSLYYKSNEKYSIASGMFLDKESFSFSSKGYYISAKWSTKNKDMVLVVENFPNKGLSRLNLASKVEKITK